MPENNIATLCTTDWNEEWKHLQRVRRRADDSQWWNKRSKNFSTKDAPNPYVEQFLDLAAVQPGETVFDMGCGTGSLAVPLALAGHKVVAGDFSQGMLDEMAKRMEEAGVTSVFPKLMSWDEDWDALGVREGMVDVCLASRSIATFDLRDSLLRLDKVARRRACVTMTTGSSPRTDKRILHAIGLANEQGNEYQYAFNILVNEGLQPTVDYIDSVRKDTFDDLKEACADFGRMVEEAVGADNAEEVAEGKKRLRSWLEANLVSNEDAGKLDKKGIAEKGLRLKTPRVITWAFIAWNK